ncbi:MAG: hypothetical protein U5K00_13470 [Melioribacteraceae bacterium]|nr:hypothetical protein [Melioribacteraceae bacterium]
MKVLLVGRYNSSENLSGPEKLLKDYSMSLLKLIMTLVSLNIFLMGDNIIYWYKFFGKQTISEEFKYYSPLIDFIFYISSKDKPDTIHIVKFERFQIVILFI